MDEVKIKKDVRTYKVQFILNADSLADAELFAAKRASNFVRMLNSNGTKLCHWSHLSVSVRMFHDEYDINFILHTEPKSLEK